MNDWKYCHFPPNRIYGFSRPNYTGVSTSIDNFMMLILAKNQKLKYLASCYTFSLTSSNKKQLDSIFCCRKTLPKEVPSWVYSAQDFTPQSSDSHQVLLAEVTLAHPNGLWDNKAIVIGCFSDRRNERFYEKKWGNEG